MKDKQGVKDFTPEELECLMRGGGGLGCDGKGFLLLKFEGAEPKSSRGKFDGAMAPKYLLASKYVNPAIFIQTNRIHLCGTFLYIITWYTFKRKFTKKLQWKILQSIRKAKFFFKWQQEGIIHYFVVDYAYIVIPTINTLKYATAIPMYNHLSVLFYQNSINIIYPI